MNEMKIVIAQERPDSADAMELVRELEEHLSARYPAESRHGYDVAKLLREEVAFFVIRLEEIPVGCGGIQIFGEEYGELKRMYVRPSFRGMALGKQLIEALSDYARSKNVRVLRLETGIHQKEAIRLYEGSSFQSIGPFGSYQPDPLSCFYEKRL